VQSSQQPLGTPYQSGGDISSSGNSFSYAACDACPVGSDKQVVGLGLNIPGPSTSSPLRPSSELAPEMLNGFGAVPFSVDYVQGLQNNDGRWRGADPGFSGLVDPRYGVYTPTPHPHATSRARSASTRGAGASISPLLCLDGLSLGENCPGNVRSTARSISHPPVNYTHSSQEIFGAGPYSYTMADFSSRGSQWSSLAEDVKPVSPIARNENGKTPLFQSRVGSDRTRAISISRRSNLDKKLLHCDVPGCGATLTSRHNFKSTFASSVPRFWIILTVYTFTRSQ
jgi:hypothetical protein